MQNSYAQRIVFFGTADYAVACLDTLVNNGFNVVAVVTATDKPAGRGQKITFSPVKEAALEHELPILQPVSMKSPEFIAELASYQADIQVVVAFRMMPEIVWNMPPQGTINVHASLLPNYRGAAPINWAIINGETETGVTTFKLKQEVDAGAMLLQEKCEILENDTFETLYERLRNMGAEALVETLIGLFEDNIKPIEQIIPENMRYAHKIFAETCLINFNQTCEQVRDLIRGLSPYPAAKFFVDGKMFKVYSAECTPVSDKKNKNGEIITDNKSYLHIFCSNGYIAINEIQPEGKKRMKIAEYLNGYKFNQFQVDNQ